MDKISISDRPNLSALREAEALSSSDSSVSDLFDSASSNSQNDDSEIQWIEATEPYEEGEVLIGKDQPGEELEDGELNGSFITKDQIKTPLTNDEKSFQEWDKK